jgi:hypothetical protein
MQMSLNGFQVITDGCTYRRDQIPAGTLGACLSASPDYPIRRPEADVKFVDPSSVPEGDAAFTEWYRTHVMRFFGVSGREYEELFSIHGLEHKLCGDPKQAAFDGLCCDGSANYQKVLQDGRDWKVVDFKARSFTKEAKDELSGWILDTYAHDRYAAPPPVTEVVSLITFKDAVRIVARALRAPTSPGREPPPSVLFPLGLAHAKPLTYKVIKASGFLYRTPGQREKICNAVQHFVDRYACGLELLALRRGHLDRRRGSISDVAEQVSSYIREGGDNLAKAFNLTRSCKELELVRESHSRQVERRRQEIAEELLQTIDTRTLSTSVRLTGVILTEENLTRIE